MSTDLTPRPARVEDDPRIAACIAESFPSNPKARLDVLRWQYRDNPFGDTASWVVEDGGRIVGHYSAYPVPYLLDGKPITAGFAVDAAVAPSHRGRRLFFSDLAAALYADCAARGMAVAVCYASNPIAMKGVARAGVRWMPRLRTLVLAVDDGWLARRFHVPRPLAAVARRAAFAAGTGPMADRVADVPAGLDELWARFAERHGVANGVDRAEAWWRWRYTDAPLGPYHLLEVRRQGALRGAAALTVRDDFGGRFGYVLELVADDRDATRALVRAAAAIEGVSGLATIAVDGGPLHRLATGAGFRTLPRRLEPKGAWFGWADATGGHDHLVDSPWHIGWGDLDHL